jgi:hypothetical protein
MAIALFYALGTGIGGVAAPTIFGALVGTGDRSALFLGYLACAILMIVGALAAVVLGVAAEGRSLEALAQE